MIAGGKQHVLSVGPQTTALNVKDLSPDTEYQINVYAITRARLSPTSGTAEVLTWAAPASGCSNLNTFITRNNLAIQTQQF